MEVGGGGAAAAAAEVPRIELAPGYSIAAAINGCWQLSDGHGGGQRGDFTRLERLVDSGFTTFDCADIYTGVEEFLGRFLRSRSGGSPVEVHTKYVPDLDSLPNLGRRDVETAIDRSLRRLGVERLDLVQFHWWDYTVPGFLEAAGWLDELRRAGKIRCLGTTNFDSQHVVEMMDAGVPLASHQVQYSLLDRRAERKLAGVAASGHAALLCYGSLAGGFLTAKYRGAADPAEPLANRSLTKYRLIVEDFGGWNALQELLAVLAEIADRHGVSIANVASRWTFERVNGQGRGAVILGLGRSDRIDENLRHFSFSLDQEDERRIDSVLRTHPGPPGSVFGLERESGGRHEALLKKNLGDAGGTRDT